MKRKARQHSLAYVLAGAAAAVTILGSVTAVTLARRPWTWACPPAPRS